MAPTAQSEVSSLEGAGFSKGAATQLVSGLNFGPKAAGRSHYDETDDELRGAAEAWATEHGIPLDWSA